MPCRELDNLMYPYLDDELIDADRVQVEAHLGACGDCRSSLDKERATWLSIRSHARAGLPLAPASLRATLESQLSNQVRVRRIRAFGTLVAAAAGVCVVTIAAHQTWRTFQRQLYVEDAVHRHARSFPLEIVKPSPEQLEAWFDGKLDHHVAVPRFQNVVAQGGRLLNVRDRQAAYIQYDADGNRRLGLFVYDDKPGDVDVNEPAIDRTNGFNTVTWRNGDVVYMLVTDLNDEDIRHMLPPRPPTSTTQIQPASFR